MLEVMSPCCRSYRWWPASILRADESGSVWTQRQSGVWSTQSFQSQEGLPTAEKSLEKERLNKQRGIYTWGAPDIHGFEIACFDDVHSDGVGSGIIAERHQQVSSSPLRYAHTHAQRHAHANKHSRVWITQFKIRFHQGISNCRQLTSLLCNLISLPFLVWTIQRPGRHGRACCSPKDYVNQAHTLMVVNKFVTDIWTKPE